MLWLVLTLGLSVLAQRLAVLAHISGPNKGYKWIISGLEGEDVFVGFFAYK